MNFNPPQETKSQPQVTWKRCLVVKKLQRDCWKWRCICFISCSLAVHLILLRAGHSEQQHIPETSLMPYTNVDEDQCASSFPSQVITSAQLYNAKLFWLNRWLCKERDTVQWSQEFDQVRPCSSMIYYYWHLIKHQTTILTFSDATYKIRIEYLLKRIFGVS